MGTDAVIKFSDKNFIQFIIFVKQFLDILMTFHSKFQTIKRDEEIEWKPRNQKWEKLILTPKHAVNSFNSMNSFG